ncbi:MAG: adenylosuccinate lyase, partial [Chitinophagaceae bacterium]|nr:adenylosuccinate lyase [Chitinophagaceae bacterium]
MNLSPLTAVSPTDGRYHSRTLPLSAYFSEYALIKYRVKVEVSYFLFLSKKGFFKLSTQNQKKLETIANSFSLSDAEKIKETEKVTNHDVKAVEYFIKEKLKALHLEKFSEWVHFGLTSQDINNTSFPMMWKEAIANEYLPQINNLTATLKQLAAEWKHIPMLARTHGQPASPTRLGKEIMVFVERLEGQIKMLKSIPHSGKFGGATGNFNAHYA